MAGAAPDATPRREITARHASLNVRGIMRVVSLRRSCSSNIVRQSVVLTLGPDLIFTLIICTDSAVPRAPAACSVGAPGDRPHGQAFAHFPACALDFFRNAHAGVDEQLLKRQL